MFPEPSDEEIEFIVDWPTLGEYYDEEGDGEMDDEDGEARLERESSENMDMSDLDDDPPSKTR
jgi:hypothetical protein